MKNSSLNDDSKLIVIQIVIYTATFATSISPDINFGNNASRSCTRRRDSSFIANLEFEIEFKISRKRAIAFVSGIITHLLNRTALSIPCPSLSVLYS